ncbi:hypothetical protein G4B88_019626 [Cannabis sativa]|uniref:Uncharacterized protein n=1 Tax=Cannabis sativa TaxID=3483 RepID=A0A7J6HSC5_CANSA|nr:hypothetical protein G4B88_019626 [Cannabis sativa]
MASSSSVISCENWAYINGNDEFELGLDFHQVAEINGTHAFLMSLMEELQDNVEEGDEERLNSVIQSLEAEINNNSSTSSTDHHHRHADQDSCMDQSSSDHDQSCSLELSLDGQDFTVSFDDLDMINEWDLDMEEVIPCSSSSSGQDQIINNGYYYAANNNYNNGTYYQYDNQVALNEEVGDNSLCLNYQTMYDMIQ